MAGVWCGADKFSRVGHLAADPLLAEVLGTEALPSQPTLTRFFRGFSQGSNTAVFGRLSRWLCGRLPSQCGGYTLDLDSTAIVHEDGHQEGVRVGLHPARFEARPSSLAGCAGRGQAGLRLLAKSKTGSRNWPTSLGSRAFAVGSFGPPKRPANSPSPPTTSACSSNATSARPTRSNSRPCASGSSAGPPSLAAPKAAPPSSSPSPHPSAPGGEVSLKNSSPQCLPGTAIQLALSPHEILFQLNRSGEGPFF